jgi:putative spermidine/putrescine transport system ATP-binding protein
VNLTVGATETVVLLGPSGSGKTTLLRVIAGLTRPATGAVTWGDVDLALVPTHERQVGMVFQDYALFPHLTVGRNVAFGLEVRGVSPSEAVEATLRMVGLEGFEDRSIEGLSGGEQQRVALARALITQPRLMLLDEPLGALDATLREHLLTELRALLAPLPTLYVTHDRIEAMAIADRIAIMRGGTIVRVDPPSRIWSDPGDTWTARFIGHENVFEGSYVPTSSIREHSAGTHSVTVVDRRFIRGAWGTTYRLGDGRTVTASITEPVAGTSVHIDFTELPLKE